MKTYVRMDGAECRKFKDGSVRIKPMKGGDSFALIFLGAAELGLIALLLYSTYRILTGRGGEAVTGLLFLVGVAVFLGYVLRHLVRRLRGMQPSYFNAESKVLELGSGQSVRQIPFASISGIYHDLQQQVTTPDASEGPPRRKPGIKVVEIGVTLKEGDRVQLGTLSGRKPSKIEKDINAVAGWIMDVTGVSEYGIPV